MAKTPTANIIRLPQVSDTTGDSKTLAASQRIATMAYTTATTTQSTADAAKSAADAAQSTADAAQKTAAAALPLTGGTVTGNTNFTGSLKYKNVEVLKVGDYGLGGSSPTIKDVDSSSTGNGFYYGGTSAAGTLPFNYFYVIQATRTGQGFQIASNVDANELKFRRIQSGVWSSWYELITTANIASYLDNSNTTQKHTNVTSSRTHSTTYTNSTTNDIIVEVVLSAVGTTTFEVISDDKTIFTLDATAGMLWPVTLKVKKGETYRINTSNTSNGRIRSWYELR